MRGAHRYTNQAVGGVLVQEGHFIAFKRCVATLLHTREGNARNTLSPCLVGVLVGNHFVIKTGNIANTLFKTQKKLSPQQARWQEFQA